MQPASAMLSWLEKTEAEMTGSVHHVDANGAHIPAIGLGTWTLRDEVAASSVASAIRSGYRHIDTAAMYDNEAAVGAGLRESGVPRDQIFLTTKVWHTEIDDGDLQQLVERLDLQLYYHVIEDLPARDTAERLNITANQVYVAKFRVLERIRTLLTELTGVDLCSALS